MSSSKVNSYNEIAEIYRESNTKPDKLYSILPTVLSLTDDLKNKVVLDLGCGDGFFTEAIATKNPRKIIGVDNSARQIELAENHASERVEYLLGDIFKDEFSKADLITAPFVLNYATDTNSLFLFLKKIYTTLTPGGKVILVYDLPNGSDLKQFGAKKTLTDTKDGAMFTIELFNQDIPICTLHATYFTEETIKSLLKKSGFIKITTHSPIISQQGIKKLGENFWKGYADNCELGYLTAEKISAEEVP